MFWGTLKSLKVVKKSFWYCNSRVKYLLELLAVFLHIASDENILCYGHNNQLRMLIYFPLKAAHFLF